VQFGGNEGEHVQFAVCVFGNLYQHVDGGPICVRRERTGAWSEGDWRPAEGGHGHGGRVGHRAPGRAYPPLLRAPLDGSGGLGKIGSAISSDAIHFTVEPGLREPTHRGAQDGFASPFVFQLPGRGYRLFYTGGGGISSETSADGLTFTRDPRRRLAENALAPLVTQQGQPVCSAIVKLAERRYRMYCSQEVQAGASSGNTLGTRAIFSAVSSDLLTWTPEPGIRIGPGAPSLTEDAAHPTAIANTDGSVTLIYYRYPVGGPEPQEMISISKDGLAFSSEADTGIRGTEPSLLRRTDGSLLVYYGEQTPAAGSTIWLARG
jgi:hypothetical protein